ncbi:N-acetylmuramoyl-L-alanine amidase [Succiniclasticum ruminis]|uniref:N-acetylmuramoyl-L-alanine amidase n=1 Tax=Succiniclasticum ruminis TaxID=40841 RepID=A0A1G6HTF6_9FIRM|nr:N-acetylmuramoyl-L-alanine amidase [Succiniclasticum ruminis]SDB97500.1 N-acetylmuramoyl-L-alanine amidase [Succiniclasticum ruminis]
MLNANPVTEDMIRDMAREARSGIRHIFLHWTGGHYGHNEEAYHICIDRDGTVYLNCKSFLSFKAHTWMHNTGAIGIALLCGCDAHCWAPAGKDASLLDVAYENDHLARTDCAVIDYGEEPPTRKQIEVMAKIVALLCRELCLPLAEDTVMTHCEIAFVDGYGPGDGDPDMRWDLWFLPEPNTLGGALYPGGLLLRAKAQYYLDTAEEGKTHPGYLLRRYGSLPASGPGY